MILILFGCLSMHKISTLTDYSTQKEREKNAHRAIKIVRAEAVRNDTKKVVAMQVVGRLQVASPSIIDETLYTLNHTSKTSPLHYQAIWTLGELGRQLPWNEDSQKIHQQLLQQLTRSKSTTEAQYLLEAIAKVYCQHSHTIEEDVQTTKRLNTYESNTEKVPDILFVLLEKIHSLPVLIALLQEQINSNSSVEESYVAVLELMTFIHENKSQLIHNHSFYQAEIKEAFDTATQMLDHNNEALTLMTVWMFGEVASDPVLAQYIIDSIVELSKEASPNTKHLIVYAISKMTSEEQSRNYFRFQYFEEEDNPTNLDMLFHSQNQDLDIIQQLYDIQLEDSNAP
jgi:hypothetical protein